MIVHRAIIHSPEQLRELAHDAYFWRRFRRFRHLERLADLSVLCGVKVGLCVTEDVSLGVGTPADWRLGPNFPEQRRKSRP